MYISVEIGRNFPKLAEIWLDLKWVVLQYRIACQYKIFQLFRLEQNEINNIGHSKEWQLAT